MDVLGSADQNLKPANTLNLGCVQRVVAFNLFCRFELFCSVSGAQAEATGATIFYVVQYSVFLHTGMPWKYDGHTFVVR